jgi:hypothetical protein
MELLLYVRGSKRQEGSVCNILYFRNTQTTMKTFTINATIDTIIDIWTLPIVLSFYLTKITETGFSSVSRANAWF